MVHRGVEGSSAEEWGAAGFKGVWRGGVQRGPERWRGRVQKGVEGWGTEGYRKVWRGRVQKGVEGWGTEGYRKVWRGRVQKGVEGWGAESMEGYRGVGCGGVGRRGIVSILVG